MPNFIVIVTDRARPLYQVSTYLGLFATEKEACKILVSHLITPYTTKDGDTSRLIDYTNICEYLEESTPDADIDDEAVEAMFEKCNTATELKKLIRNCGCSLFEDTANNDYGWTFTIHRVRGTIAVDDS